MTSLAGNNPKIYVVAAFCTWFAAASFWHAAQTWTGSDARLVRGRIVSYEPVPQIAASASRCMRPRHWSCLTSFLRM
jgi:hypothetical protein